MEASILLIKCIKTRKTIGARIQKMSNGDWLRTWAFEIDMSRAKSEGYDSTGLTGSLGCTDEYPGCPGCGTFGFVQCGVCKKISCYNGETSLICPWCNTKLEGMQEASSFDVDTNAF